ncbi:hypothetical protein [Rossellomorea sp. KS-H15a]|uniref:hypothetical protein n=1 Tax=Rossellomorea sp. KS-H15a TaxID=2963940 RepID=UPI0020C67409|nr:hypothetical protein [Rossellomorea sp. KS-H15a]UTE77995.1 hypothetical protein M1J35_04295 [Rossellomorea sp. KS-H15a]
MHRATIILIAILFIFPLTSCSQKETNHFDKQKVADVVIAELESNFDYTFKVNHIEYDPLRHTYMIDASITEKPDMSFSSDITDRELEESDVSKINGYVVDMFYQEELEGEVEKAVRKALPNYQVAKSSYLTPPEIHLEDKKFIHMSFSNFTRQYQDEVFYTFYLLSNEDFSQDYFENNQQALRALFSELKNEHYKLVKFTIVFPNDTYIETERLHIEDLEKQSLHEQFAIKKDPSIPGFDYKKWKQNLQ